jgi:LuxR family maltose regulon positive regulatory protein
VLFEWLREQPVRSITVVTAPAGFGKTTLLAGWSEALSQQKHPVAWLSLDAEDDDPQQFGAYLVAAFGRASAEIASQAQQILNKDPLTPIRTVISLLLNGIAASGQRVFLVLDDADRLTAKPVLAITSRLLRYAPENMHILLGARAQPALMVGQFRAPKEVVRINADDLRFSIAEAQAFFDRTGTVPLDRSSVELLNEATEGWVAGLQLASLALREAGDAAKVASDLAGAGCGIDSYLNDTVLAHLPLPMLKFLLYTSILERLAPALCDAVMGEASGGGAKLDWLDRHSVFIRPLNEARDWYRYHALLSDALRRRLLRQMPQQVPLLHRRASQWFAEARLWPEAVRHALAAGDVEQAAQWVENCATDMLERGELYTLLGWIGKLPPDVIKGRLRLRLTKAWALVFSIQPDAASREIEAVTDEFRPGCRKDSRVLEEAALAEINAVSALIAIMAEESERALELGCAAQASMAPMAPWVQRCAQFAQVFGLMQRGRFDLIHEMRDAVGERVEQSQEPDYSDMFRRAQFGAAAFAHGDLSESRRIFEAIFHSIEKAWGPSSSSATWAASCLAAIYYECNELPEARKMIAGRTTIALESSPLTGLMRHVLCAARLLWRDGQTGSALAILEDGRQAAVTRHWLRLKLAVDAETVRLLLVEGNLAQARQIADELGKSVPTMCEGRTGCAVDAWTSYCLVQARVLIAGDRADEAVTLLTPLLESLAATGRRYSEVVVSLLFSCALAQCGASEKALGALEPALRVGRQNGMINSFVDEGPPVRALLQGFRRTSANVSMAEMAYVERLLTAFDAFGNSPTALPVHVKPAPMSPDVLSARECEVLKCVARGLSNKEIGRLLKLAPETVKWHLKNIFEKLDVSSRIEAVQRVFGFGGGEGRAAM